MMGWLRDWRVAEGGGGAGNLSGGGRGGNGGIGRLMFGSDRVDGCCDECWYCDDPGMESVGAEVRWT